MALSLADTRAELAGIDGLLLREGPSGCLVAEGVDPQSWLTTWQRLREAVPRTGRFPLAMSNEYGEVDDLFEQLELQREGVSPPMDWAAQQAVVEGVDPWGVYDPSDRFGHDVPDDQVRHYVPHGDEQLAAQAVHELPPPRTLRAVTRWSYDLIRTRPELGDGYDFTWRVSRAAWYEPSAVGLVLLPSPHPWMAGIWGGFWGAWGDRAHALPAAMRAWHARWGAEPVANWGTVLQFLVARPPTAADEAWSVAEQILTIAESNHEDIWALALGLPHGHHWLLHSRP
jgi:hypothetical protein